MVSDAESVHLPAIHKHLDRLVRVASAESDECHQRPAVTCTRQLHTKVRHVGDHISVNDAFLNELFWNAVRDSYKSIDLSGRNKRDMERFLSKHKKTADWLRKQANGIYF